MLFSDGMVPLGLPVSDCGWAEPTAGFPILFECFGFVFFRWLRVGFLESIRVGIERAVD